jgi:RimJ/RimL family protein N-acetyltransferase
MSIPEIPIPLRAKNWVLTDFKPDDFDVLKSIGLRIRDKAAVTPGYKNFFWFAGPLEKFDQDVMVRLAAAIDGANKRPRVMYSLAIRLADKNDLIGRVAIDLDGVGDIGYFIDPKHDGNHYGLDVSRTVLGQYFKYFPVMEATADPENLPSARIFARLGAKVVGHKDKSDYDGSPRDIYRLTHQDFLNSLKQK